MTGAAAAPQFVMASLPTGMVYSHKLIVFPFEGRAAFAVLQSRVHELWARFFSRTLKDDLQYALSDCFETFPFSNNLAADSALEVAGQAYYEFRAALMIRNDEGLTTTYNRFHNPNEHDVGIARLRELHADMDRAVLDTYGWTDIPTDCEFIVDYEVDEEDPGRARKPYRYRWPNAVRDEVLARLIALNGERAAEEQRSGAAANAGAGGHAARSGRAPRKSRAHAREALF